MGLTRWVYQDGFTKMGLPRWVYQDGFNTIYDNKEITNTNTTRFVLYEYGYTDELPCCIVLLVSTLT